MSCGHLKRLPPLHDGDEETWLIPLRFKKPRSLFQLPIYLIRIGFGMGNSLKITDAELEKCLIENQKDGTVSVLKNGKKWINGLEDAAFITQAKVESGHIKIYSTKHVESMN